MGSIHPRTGDYAQRKGMSYIVSGQTVLIWWNHSEGISWWNVLSVLSSLNQNFPRFLVYFSKHQILLRVLNIPSICELLSIFQSLFVRVHDEEKEKHAWKHSHQKQRTKCYHLNQVSLHFIHEVHILHTLYVFSVHEFSFAIQNLSCSETRTQQ